MQCSALRGGESEWWAIQFYVLREVRNWALGGAVLCVTTVEILISERCSVVC